MRSPIFLPTTLFLAVTCATSNVRLTSCRTSFPEQGCHSRSRKLRTSGSWSQPSRTTKLANDSSTWETMESLRSFGGAGQVIAYHALSPNQIAQYIERFQASVQEHLLEVYESVDGRNVTDSTQLTDPPTELRPPRAMYTIQPRAGLLSTCHAGVSI
jgi:hypothetical protein